VNGHGTLAAHDDIRETWPRVSRDVTTFGGRRLVALDGLRGIAAFMVFIHHVQLHVLHPQLIGMDAGVLVFFALSGYLLYAPFVAARNALRPVDLRGYAIRRVLRILPAYLVASLAIGLLLYPESLRDPIGILTMAHTSIIVAWTLQLEVVFYALLPLLAWLLRPLPAARRSFVLVAIGAASILITVVIMAAVIQATGSVESTQLQTFVSFAWAFIPGMLVAELHGRNRLGSATSAWVGLAGIGLIAVSVAIDLPSSFDLAAGIGAGLVIAHLVARPELPAALVTPAAAAGALSYSFYLWHEALIPAIDRPATWSGAAIALVASLAVAAVVYWSVERPCIELGRRLSRRTRGQARETPAPAPVVGS
jgi:peptidoglycan/LPS O-acetylase OafA/YrhL